MAKKKTTTGVSRAFHEINLKYEEEVLEIYALLTEEQEDIYLKNLKSIFKHLKIPRCFTQDILDALNYYYETKSQISTMTDPKSKIVLQMVHRLTITSDVTSHDNIFDIIDIDKLIRYTNQLLYYRDNYLFIKETWNMLIDSVVDHPLTPGQRLGYRLTLVDLKRLKAELNLDGLGKQTLSDMLLIDMLSCCQTDDMGNINNFDLSRTTEGLFIGIKDFACILGNMGEYD